MNKEIDKIRELYEALPREKQMQLFPSLIAILQSDSAAYEIMYINCDTFNCDTFVTAAANKEEAVRDFKKSVDFDLDNKLKIIYVNEL